MSNVEQLLLLYDEAIKRLRRSELALEKRDYGTFDDCIVRSVRIIRYLNQILDMSQPISHDLRRIYDYLIYDLSFVRSGRERRKKEIGRIAHILSELREAFEEAGRRVTGDHIVSLRSVVG